MINNEQIQALKAAAEKAKEYGGIAMYSKAIKANQAFKEAATPEAILSLLAEREADKALIAELQGICAAAEKLVRCKGRYHSEQNYRALAALFGVNTPELPPLDNEARTLTVKLPERCECCYSEKEAALFDGVVEEYTEALKSACAAAGITLVVGE